MKTKIYTLFCISSMAALSLLSSCVKDELYDTPHPDRGAVTVTVNLPQGSVPDDYTVVIGGQELENRDGSFVTPEPLEPGEYTVLAYNTPEGFDVEEGIARVRVVNDTRALSTLIDPLPGYLYSGKERITVMADDTLRIDLGVVQRVRDLDIRLDVTEGDYSRIVSVEGILAGIAGAYDMLNETLYGEPVSTSPDFVREEDRITASLRLLGILGDVQTLTLRIVFSDGQEQEVVSDLTALLAGFNSGDMGQPLRVTGNLSVPAGADFSATIDGWQQTDAGNTDAH